MQIYPPRPWFLSKMSTCALCFHSTVLRSLGRVTPTGRGATGAARPTRACVHVKATPSLTRCWVPTEPIVMATIG